MASRIDFDLHLDTSGAEFAGLLAQAETLAGAIRSMPIPPQVREEIDRLEIRREIRGTTGIEGIEVSEDEVAAILSSDADALPRERANVEHEVRNAALVGRDVAEMFARDPGAVLTEATICRMHRLMTEGAGYAHNTPGVYRSHPVVVGTYRPPGTRDEVATLMQEFIRWVNGPKAAALHPIVRAVAAHFYLVSIHPFGDGNGRTSRAVESFMLYRANINILGFHSLSNFYYRHRDGYINALNEVQVRSSRDLSPFVLFALRGLVEELQRIWDAVAREMTSIAFMNHAHHQLLAGDRPNPRASERMYRLVIGVTEPVAIGSIRRGGHPLGELYRDLSAKTLSRDIDALLAMGLIVRENGTIRSNLELVRAFQS